MPLVDKHQYGFRGSVVGVPQPQPSEGRGEVLLGGGSAELPLRPFTSLGCSLPCPV